MCDDTANVFFVDDMYQSVGEGEQNVCVVYYVEGGKPSLHVCKIWGSIMSTNSSVCVRG